MDVSAVSPPQDTLESRRSLVDRLGDLALRWISALAAIGVIALIGLIIYEVISQSRPAFSAFGLGFIWHETWNAVTNQFGALDFLVATLYVTSLAVLLAGPVAIAIGLYLSELAPSGVRGVVGSLVEMLAAIPSVVLGLWGIIILGPVVHNEFGPWLNDVLGWTPFFATRPISGSTMFTAVLVLAIMIVPITAADQPRPIPAGADGHQGGCSRSWADALGDGEGGHRAVHARRPHLRGSPRRRASTR